MTGDIRQQLIEALDQAEKLASGALLHPTRFDPNTLEHIRDGTDDGVWHVGEHYHECEVATSSGEIVVYDEGRPTAAQALHIARWDPSTVLRLVERDRQLLAGATTVEAAIDATLTAYGGDELAGMVLKAVAKAEVMEGELRRAAAFWLGTPEVDR